MGTIVISDSVSLDDVIRGPAGSEGNSRESAAAIAPDCNARAGLNLRPRSSRPDQQPHRGRASPARAR